jgi:chorismate mutase/prephenate dehydratase
VLEHDLCIVGAHLVPVRLCLAALRAVPLHELRAVRSHPEALRQCRKLLRRLPAARREPASSTSAAARALRDARGSSRGEDVAVLCAPDTAQACGLSILVEQAADHADNQTLFVVVGLADTPSAPSREQAGADHTALVMTTAHRHGALSRCLSRLAEAEIQLTHLESRPLAGRPWEVQFAMEAEGSPHTEPLRRALDDLRSLCTHLKVLGTWHESRPSRAEPEVVAQAVARPREPACAPEPERKRPERLVDAHPDRPRTVVHVGEAAIGAEDFVLIGGPCSVESEEQVLEIAAAVKRAGGVMLRGGAFKPRTSPYSFQGLGEEGLRLLQKAGRAHGLPVVTEVMRPEQIEVCAEYADVLQVGARNMQNFSLLAEVGACRRPVLLKRGMSATIDELLGAAEYILARGNTQVVLCERGIRTFETSTRATLDLSAVPVLLERTHLPVIVDPSHAAGTRRYVPSLSRAAKAVGAHGIIVEVHPEPAKALCDGPQALTIDMWDALARELKA